MFRARHQPPAFHATRLTRSLRKPGRRLLLTAALVAAGLSVLACGSVDVEDYGRDCEVDADCVEVPSSSKCAPCGGGWTALSTDEASEYLAERDAEICGPTPPVACTAEYQPPAIDAECVENICEPVFDSEFAEG